MIGTPVMTETEFESESYASCSYAQLRNKVKMWLGVDAMLIEVNVTAEKSSEFSGMAWSLYIPVSRFAGVTVEALMANGSLVLVKLREEHVPGNYSLAWLEGGAGWIIPLNEGGLLVAFYSNAWSRGVTIDVVDGRECGGGSYEVRGWLGHYISMVEGQVIGLPLYLKPYRSQDELNQAISTVLTALEDLGMGEPLSTVRIRLVATLRLEEAREGRKSMTPTYYMLGALAFMAVLAALIGYYMLKTRR